MVRASARVSMRDLFAPPPLQQRGVADGESRSHRQHRHQTPGGPGEILRFAQDEENARGFDVK